jgi:deazaflavin-dependent oxidoreductase (nitroreductase family)
MIETRSTRLPGVVTAFDPIARRLLGRGVPLGPNALLTVRGRKSGLPRTTPLAVVEIGGRRWVIGTFGETDWTRNLRAAGEGTVTQGRRRSRVTAVELGPEEATRFFVEVLQPFVRRIPLGLGRLLLGRVLGAAEMLDDPELAARNHPVFELRPAS